MTLPPVHPALVHLPIAFVLLSVLADLFARINKTESHRATLRIIGFWSLVAGLAGGVLTIAAGYLDFARDNLARETSQFIGLHITIGWILAGGLLFLTAWRWLIWHRGQMTIGAGYLIAGFLVLGVTLFQGWYGSEMVYSYGAGVAVAGQGTETPEAAQSRLMAIRNAFEPGAVAVGGAESPGGTNQAGAKRPPPGEPR